MSSNRARSILCNGPVHLSMDCSSHHPPSLPMPGLCMPIAGSETRESGLLNPVVPDLFSDDCRHKPLNAPLARHPCLLIHHLADHLALVIENIAALRDFNSGPL